MNVQNKKRWMIFLLPVLLIAAMAVIYVFAGPQGVSGNKTVVLEVVGKDAAESRVYTVASVGESLRQFMEAAEGISFSGEESVYGLMVTEVNGERAEEGCYWAFYVNGAYCEYGIDDQPAEDGDVFRIEYTVYAS